MANPDTIMFDTERLRRTANRLTEISTDMTNISNELGKSVEEMITLGWRGQGANKFRTNMMGEWRIGMQAYCDLLNHLTTILNEAADKYSDVESDMNSLTVGD